MKMEMNFARMFFYRAARLLRAKMTQLPLPERLTRIEDEIALFDSALDARTRLLWQEVEKLRGELAEIRSALVGRYSPDTLNPRESARNLPCKK